MHSKIELEFENVGFLGEGKTAVPGEKPLGAEPNKLNPDMTPGPGIEPGTHWWEASAPTTEPTLFPPYSKKQG